MLTSTCCGRGCPGGGAAAGAVALRPWSAAPGGAAGSGGRSAISSCAWATVRRVERRLELGLALADADCAASIAESRIMPRPSSRRLPLFGHRPAALAPLPWAARVAAAAASCACRSFEREAHRRLGQDRAAAQPSSPTRPSSARACSDALRSDRSASRAAPPRRLRIGTRRRAPSGPSASRSRHRGASEHRIWVRDLHLDAKASDSRRHLTPPGPGICIFIPGQDVTQRRRHRSGSRAIGCARHR